MEIRTVGNSGLAVSVVGLGCNNFGARMDDDATAKVIDAAFDHGITLFDTADVYGNLGGSETLLGKLLGPRRKEIVLATKFSKPMDAEGRLSGNSRRYIMRAVEDSLRRLKTDWIDLYQIHDADPKTPIEETLRALDDLVRSGKVRYLGYSNFAAWQVVEAHWTAQSIGVNRPVVCQDEYSLLVRHHEKELFPAMEACGLGLLPFFPLASGLLTGKYRPGMPPPEGSRFAKVPGLKDRFGTDAQAEKAEELRRFAESRGHTLLELAFSWLASHRFVSSVIAGATRPEQIAANVKAVGWKLSAEELAEVDRITL